MDTAGNKVRAIAAAFSLLLVVVAIGRVSSAAFTDTTDNSANTFDAGDVTITDDDGGATAMFSLPDMAPGDTATRCINVTYAGTLQADVVLYGSHDGGGLEDHLALTIERSTGAGGGTGFDCTGFVEAGLVPIWDPTDGTIGAFTALNDGVTNSADSRSDPGTSNDVASYRFTVTLLDNDAAQGLSSLVAFTWRASSA